MADTGIERGRGLSLIVATIVLEKSRPAVGGGAWPAANAAPACVGKAQIVTSAVSPTPRPSMSDGSIEKHVSIVGAAGTTVGTGCGAAAARPPLGAVAGGVVDRAATAGTAAGSGAAAATAAAGGGDAAPSPSAGCPLADDMEVGGGWAGAAGSAEAVPGTMPVPSRMTGLTASDAGMANEIVTGKRPVLVTRTRSPCSFVTASVRSMAARPTSSGPNSKAPLARTKRFETMAKGPRPGRGSGRALMREEKSCLRSVRTAGTVQTPRTRSESVRGTPTTPKVSVDAYSPTAAAANWTAKCADSPGPRTQRAASAGKPTGKSPKTAGVEAVRDATSGTTGMESADAAATAGGPPRLLPLEELGRTCFPPAAPPVLMTEGLGESAAVTTLAFLAMDGGGGSGGSASRGCHALAMRKCACVSACGRATASGDGRRTRLTVAGGGSGRSMLNAFVASGSGGRSPT